MSVMIVFTSKRTSSATGISILIKPRHISACYVAIHCSLCMPLWQCLVRKCWNVYLIYLELLPFAIPCDTTISLHLSYMRIGSFVRGAFFIFWDLSWIHDKTGGKILKSLKKEFTVVLGAKIQIIFFLFFLFFFYFFFVFILLYQTVFTLVLGWPNPDYFFLFFFYLFLFYPILSYFILFFFIMTIICFYLFSFVFI